MPILPTPRGPLTAALFAAWSRGVHTIDAPEVPEPADVLVDEDLQLALYACYELHYRGFDGVDPEWEWEPSLLELRRHLEDRLEAALLDRVGPPADAPDPAEMDVALRAVVGEGDDAASLSRFIERHATLEQVQELMVHRSAYQLKEADPHSFALPRLYGGPKAAMVEIQADEYGGGREDRMHATLFANTMRALGLDATYGAYIDHIPGYTLAGTNLVSWFGLHRRWRGAAAGHLALFEIGSSVPSGRYARGLRRLEVPGTAVEFFDEHVIADAVHENIAAVDLAGGLARLEPDLAADILWGARTLAAVDAVAEGRLMAAWRDGASTLRVPLRGAARRAEAGDLVA